MTIDYTRLGERIREERLHLRLTQAKLAEAVDISDAYMGAIERGGEGNVSRHPRRPCLTPRRYC